MFEHFDEAAGRALVLAQAEAFRLGHDYLGTEHLLLAVAGEDGGMGSTVLDQLGFDTEMARRRVEEIVCSPRLGRQEAEALGSIGIDLEEVRRRVEATFGPGALDRPIRGRGRLRGKWARCNGLPLTPRAKKVLELSLNECRKMGHGAIGTQHVLAGLLSENEGLGAALLAEQGIEMTEVRRLIAEGHGRGSEPPAAGA